MYPSGDVMKMPLYLCDLPPKNQQQITTINSSLVIRKTTEKYQLRDVLQNEKLSQLRGA